MDRREFLTKAGLVTTWAAIPITITACSSDDNPTDGGNGGGSDTEDVDGTVGEAGGHSHAVTITGAQIDAMATVTLTLTGSGHIHTVVLTAQEVEDVADGNEVSRTSSSDEGHTHPVTFNQNQGASDVDGVVTEGGHPHDVTLTGAEIDAGVAVTLTLSQSGHTHTVNLTAQEVGDVGAGTQVIKRSSNSNGHDHTVTFN